MVRGSVPADDVAGAIRAAMVGARLVGRVSLVIEQKMTPAIAGVVFCGVWL